MKRKSRPYLTGALAGMGAGIVNGIFGAAGGMILIPVLAVLGKLPEESLFPTSVSVMLPVCVVSLLVSGPMSSLPWGKALPYLIGGSLGGIAAGLWGRKIPTVWLHRIFGIMILWGGLRYLW